MATQDNASENIKPHPLRVLLVDDNTDQADTLAQLLSGWGHEVRVFYDGLTALEAAQVYQPNLAMIDLGLPGIDGYQVALRLRREPALKDMKLIAVTGSVWQDAPIRSAQYGFDDHFAKPVDLDRLRALLSNAMAKNNS
jgi:CheY-like chemotaxis protein